ncbi:N-formylglutamate deformylase [Povalibacter uvarum]|uniref:N-formylglutamate deformylase n=1 Tax=Povalibacter uvarum TaxID=732238 RepID=UPI001C8661E6|nr:N-formylglutamate deformylase [Povalibacter uvarum]
MLPYAFHRGSQPLLISVPHAGTQVPDEIARRFTAAGRELIDTDWYVDQLYGFAADLGASIVSATYSRYVVDLNRGLDSVSLYASNPTSPVCPVRTFDNRTIYQSGAEPGEGEIADRIEHYWHPYHQCVAEELWRIRSEHGYALLWDAHSIISRVPELFDGELPEFNFGTRDHASCPATVAEALLESVRSDGKHSAVLNGRFKGGYITMAYGRPADRVWAVQLELAQRTYMNETPRSEWSVARAAPAASKIQQLLRQYLSLARTAVAA